MKKILVALFVAASALVFGASPADAHASLTWSSPAVGSVLETAPTEVTLVFDDDIQVIDGTEANLIEVTNEDGEHFETGDTQVNAAKVFVALSDLTDGTYTVAYKVISADGHPVSSEYQFELNTGASQMSVDSVKRSVVGSEPADAVAYSANEESSEDQATDDPTPGEAVEDMPMDMPMTTSVGGENAQSNDAAVVAWLAAVVVLVGGGAFYVLKVRKPKP